MILNQTTLNNAIAKAKCCLANKTIEYFDKLALGIDKDCLFKEAIVLKGYINTLSNFEIVGSKTTCDCCINGNYTFNLDGVNSESQIQFNCNNEGWIVSNNTNYPFTYIYDSYNNLLNIQLTNYFPNLIVNGTFNTDTNGWTISYMDDWTWSSYNGGSILYYNGVDAGGVFSQDILTVGETYSVEFDIYLENQDYYGKANLVVSLGTNSLEVFPLAAITTTSTIHIKTTLVCLGNSTFSFSVNRTRADGYKNFYIDNVVVKKLSLYILNIKFNDNCDIIVESSNFPLFYNANLDITCIPSIKSIIPNWDISEPYIIEVNGSTIIYSNTGISNTAEFIEDFNTSNSGNYNVSVFNNRLVFTNLNYPGVSFVFMDSNTIIAEGVLSTCPIEILNEDGVIKIYDNTSTLIESLIIPGDIINNPLSIVDYWNINSTQNFTLSYSNNIFTMVSPMFKNVENWYYTFTRQELPYSTSLTNPIGTIGYQGFAIEFDGSIPNIAYSILGPPEVSPSAFLTLIQNAIDTTSYEGIVSYNAYSGTFIITSSSNTATNFKIIFATGEGLNTNSNTFASTEIMYTGEFETVEDTILKNNNTCESKIISQTCLTNKQVISIIQHINKICKNC